MPFGGSLGAFREGVAIIEGWLLASVMSGHWTSNRRFHLRVERIEGIWVRRPGSISTDNEGIVMSSDSTVPQVLSPGSWEEAVAHLIEGRVDLASMPVDCTTGSCLCLCPCGPGWPFCGGGGC
jgi:hypothetical protein